MIREAASPAFVPPSAEARDAILRKHGLTRPYFLYVGNAKEHKNVQTLIDAFAALSDPQRELVSVAGGGGFIEEGGRSAGALRRAG